LLGGSLGHVDRTSLGRVSTQRKVRSLFPQTQMTIVNAQQHHTLKTAECTIVGTK
jgi:hypothetical protein